MHNASEGIRILSLDAKDIYIANHYNDLNGIGYNVRSQDGGVNLKKFINTLDASIELTKIRDVYYQIYRNKRFSFFDEYGHEYTQRVINVTFKYSNKEYNRITKDIYVKFGYKLNDLTLTNNVCIQNGELIAIKVGEKTPSPVSLDVLGKYFYYDKGCYHAKSNIKVLQSVADLRRELYKNGFVCDGIKYIRFKRSNGSSRVGKCLFIDENFYKRMFNWTRCGLSVKHGQEIDLPAFESYTALPLSSNIDTLEISPNSILLIDDYESVFKDKVMATRIVDGVLVTKPDEVEIHNSIWDGQSLMDKSAFGKYASKGFLLLRNRFFKSACFNCNLQQWFADNGITDLSQLNGFTRAKCIEDIKLVTTPSSIKYLKFGSLDQWLDNIEPIFGVVKYEKPTHYFDGRLVQTHYQLINTLQLSQEEVNEFLQPSKDYLNALKTDESVVRFHIKCPKDKRLTDAPMLSKNDVIYNLMGINEKFCQTEIYYEFVKEVIRSYRDNIKSGHVMVNGNYSTIAGNPYEMLLSCIGKFDGQSTLGVGNIHSKRFAYNQPLLGSRSPHCCAGNVWVANNVEDKLIDGYFNFTNEIVCINSIGENVLQRLNGCDFDSDSVLLTDNPILLKSAIKNYNKWLVPTNMVEAKKIKRHYTTEDLSDLDIKTSVNKIGEIINLAQKLTSIAWNKINSGASIDDVFEIYRDICQLSVMSNIEIDKAKKEFDVDNTVELKKIARKYEVRDEHNNRIEPFFMGVIAKQKVHHKKHKHVVSAGKKYTYCLTAMDFLEKSINKRINNRKPDSFIPFSEVISFDKYENTNVNKSQVEKIITNIRHTRLQIKNVWDSNEYEILEKHHRASQLYCDCVNLISSNRLGLSTMFYLLKVVDKIECSDIRSSLINILFSTTHKDFYFLLKESQKHLPSLEYNPDGEVHYYNIGFKKS